MNENNATPVETPSGKDAGYENFPVGSFLLPAALRPHIKVFYRFARTIDDIADNPELSAEEKIRRLTGFQDAIAGRNSEDEDYLTGHGMRESLLQTGISERHCLDLITAFKQDAVKNRYKGWADLMGYCQLSAAPVGRYLIDLHGGGADGYGPSDCLCNALQVINHLQDCKDDYLTMDRVYLPTDWMNEARISVDVLGGPKTTPGLRTVIDRCISETEVLLGQAALLPVGVGSLRLAMESQAIVNIAWRLVDKLKHNDPLGNRIELNKLEYAACSVFGVFSVLFSNRGNR